MCYESKIKHLNTHTFVSLVLNSCYLLYIFRYCYIIGIPSKCYFWGKKVNFLNIKLAYHM